MQGAQILWIVIEILHAHVRTMGSKKYDKVLFYKRKETLLRKMESLSKKFSCYTHIIVRAPRSKTQHDEEYAANENVIQVGAARFRKHRQTIFRKAKELSKKYKCEVFVEIQVTAKNRYEKYYLRGHAKEK